jgi:acetyl esterase/lipase
LRARILIALLAASLLFNVAGLVFFFLFLGTHKHYKAVQRQRNELAHELNILKKAGVDELLAFDKVVPRAFISHYDGQEDVVGISEPAVTKPRTDLTLIVYLHGMGSSFLEPFTKPEVKPIARAVLAKDPSIVILSCSYRKAASFGNDQAIEDINQNIREVCQQYPIKKILLMGTSMGGCVALNYATCAPKDIKDRIVGIVSVEGAGDMAALYHQSSRQSVREAMINAFGGTPEQVARVYAEKSFLSHVGALPPKVKVAVISATHDTIVPPRFQKDIVKALEENNVSTRLIEINDGHTTPPTDIYLKGLDFALSL